MLDSHRFLIAQTIIGDQRADWLPYWPPGNLEVTVPGLAKLTRLWQAVVMGNKDARKREKKKPKQKPPKREAFNPAPARVIRDVTPQKQP
jgi:hypothetical protein